ncbi:MAG: winged helix-turn-helix transcriptional regulator [Lentisphaerae bacterium]|nr:winged helix-turn-helix transcriptional regulator [Lentisphaerota bacterium]
MRLSKSESETLRPTLWRTCRVLASKTRLRVLGELRARPEQRVSDVAQRLGLSLPLASQALRALNSRGLLLARRSGPSVYYRLGANRSIAHSGRLLKTLKKTFARGKNPGRNVFRYATAFTHPRRIRIIQHLRERPMRLEEIAGATNIPLRALNRHLRKLVARGFLKHADCWYVYSVPPHEFARVLLFLMRSA